MSRPPLRDWHHSRDAGGKPSSAAIPNSADRRGSSGSHIRSDDKGVSCRWWAAWPTFGGGLSSMFITSARSSRRLPKWFSSPASMPIGPMNQVVMLTSYISPRRDLHRTSRTRMSCMGWAGCLSQRNRWSCKCPTLGIASGRSRCTTRARTRLASLGCNMAPNPVSTWSWGRTGKAKPPPALPAWCARPPTSPQLCRASS